WAVMFEGGRPWTLFQHWREAIPIVGFRAVFMLVTTYLSAGLIRLIWGTPPRSSLAAAFAVSIGFALFGYVLIDYAPPNPGSLTIWFPSVLFAPRLAASLSGGRRALWVTRTN